MLVDFSHKIIIVKGISSKVTYAFSFIFSKEWKRHLFPTAPEN